MPKFLLIRFSSIGDVVLTTPVIRCLKKQVNDAEVHFLTKNSFAEIIENNLYIDKKIYFEDDLNAIIKNLKAENYDYIIDLHNNLRTFLIKLWLMKKSFSFNKLNFEKWLMVNSKINRLPNIHIVDRYMETIKSLGVTNCRSKTIARCLMRQLNLMRIFLHSRMMLMSKMFCDLP